MTVYSPGERPAIEYSPSVLVTALPPLGESVTIAPCNTPPAESVARPFTEPDPCARADAANINAATTPISARLATFVTKTSNAARDRPELIDLARLRRRGLAVCCAEVSRRSPLCV